MQLGVVGVTVALGAVGHLQVQNLASKGKGGKVGRTKKKKECLPVCPVLLLPATSKQENKSKKHVSTKEAHSVSVTAGNALVNLLRHHLPDKQSH